MVIENQKVDLMDITPSWFYKKFKYQEISSLCNVLTWQGSVVNGEDTLADHAVSICIAIPKTSQETGPFFAGTYLANLSDFLVHEKVANKLYVCGDSIKTYDENNKEVSVSFGFRRYLNGISFEYYGFPNYTSGEGAFSLGMNKDMISKFQNVSTMLAVSMCQTAFVNGIFASI